MRVGNKTQCVEKPSEFNINKLFGNTYELSHLSDIEEITVKREDTEVEEKQFAYTLYIGTMEINNYEEMVAALVGLKYTISDEIALLKKIQNGVDKIEILSYNEYVEKCKQVAREYWGIE